MMSVIQVVPTAEMTLIVSMAGKTKQYAQVETNLFREVSRGVSLLPGISPRLLAFQENDQGDTDGPENPFANVRLICGEFIRQNQPPLGVGA